MNVLVWLAAILFILMIVIGGKKEHGPSFPYS